MPIRKSLYWLPAAPSPAPELADLEMIDICAIDSNDITLGHCQKIKELAEQLDQDPEVAGIVITHGTDTLEESVFLLNLSLNVHKPMVITGAIRPATSASPDGPMNLYQAIALACRKKAGDLGVLCLFSNTIIPPGISPRYTPSKPMPFVLFVKDIVRIFSKKILRGMSASCAHIPFNRLFDLVAHGFSTGCTEKAFSASVQCKAVAAIVIAALMYQPPRPAVLPVVHDGDFVTLRRCHSAPGSGILLAALL